MYQIKKGTELNLAELGKILLQFQTKELVYLNKMKNYFDGKMAILQRKPSDSSKLLNNTVCNYCSVVVDSFQGYLAGKPIQYADISEELLDILNYNDCKAEDTDFLGDALVYGKAFEIVYKDSDDNGAQRIKLLDPRTCIDIYDDTLNEELQYVVRFWQTNLVEESQPSYTVEVYGNDWTRVYSSSAGFASFTLLEERPNYYNQVPITVFNLNRECKSIFDQVTGLNDSYNELLSDEITDFSSFADAYLCLTGNFADEEQLNSMKQHRVLMLDEGSKAEYLTKDIHTTQIKEMLDNLNQQIFNKAQCVDFSSEEFNASTGIALKMKLIGMENKASSIESQMKKALQKRLEILCSVLNLLGGDANWRDVKFIFTRNIPTILSDTTEAVNALRGLVSNETLLGLLPFVDSVETEMDKLKKEREDAMSTYGAFLNENTSTYENNTL